MTDRTPGINLPLGWYVMIFALGIIAWVGLVAVLAYLFRLLP